MAQQMQQRSGQRQDAYKLEDQIKGTLYGNLVGDAIGLLTEFMDKQQALKCYGKVGNLEYAQKVNDRHRSHWVIGDWTDDGDQMILIMQSILDNDGKVLEVDYGRRLKQWSRKGFPELGDLGGCGLGATTHKVLKHPSFDETPHLAAKDVWEKSGQVFAPNGAVMRTSILGVYHYWNMAEVVQYTRQICETTHADPRCVASCVAVTTAIATMLQRDSRYLLKNGQFNIDLIIDDSCEKGGRFLTGEHNSYTEEMQFHMKCKKLKDLKLDEQDKIGYTFKCLGAGFWALKQGDFRTALEAITREGGDADTNGAVAGALLGCKLGLSRIPESWIEDLADRNRSWFETQLSRFMDLNDRLHHQKVASFQSNTQGPPQTATQTKDPNKYASANTITQGQKVNNDGHYIGNRNKNQRDDQVRDYHQRGMQQQDSHQMGSDVDQRSHRGHHSGDMEFHSEMKHPYHSTMTPMQQGSQHSMEYERGAPVHSSTYPKMGKGHKGVRTSISEKNPGPRASSQPSDRQSDRGSKQQKESKGHLVVHTNIPRGKTRPPVADHDLSHTLGGPSRGPTNTGTSVHPHQKKK